MTELERQLQELIARDRAIRKRIREARPRIEQLRQLTRQALREAEKAIEIANEIRRRPLTWREYDRQHGTI